MKIDGYIFSILDDHEVPVWIWLDEDEVDCVTLVDSEEHIHLTSANHDLVMAQIDDHFDNQTTPAEDRAYAQELAYNIRRGK